MSSLNRPKRRITRLLEEYSENHQHPLNVKIHWVAVPLIVFSVIGLLGLLPFEWQFRPYFNWALLLIALSAVYYMKLSLRLSLGILIFYAVCLRWSVELSSQLSHQGAVVLYAVIFFLAWAAQFYGHRVEAKRPSFLKDLQFLLLGPAWLMAKVYRLFNLKY